MTFDHLICRGSRAGLAPRVGVAALAAALFVTGAAATPAKAALTRASAERSNAAQPLQSGLELPPSQLLEPQPIQVARPIGELRPIRPLPYDPNIISHCSRFAPSGWCGDGGPATASQLSDPHQIAPLPGGGFLIADTGNSVIRKVDAAGVISTVAGMPFARGEQGDGGPAIDAQLDQPMGVVAFPDGGFAIADTGNHVIRVVSPEGSIGTLGSADGFAEPRGLALGADGDLLVADAALHRVFRLSRSGGQGVVAGTGVAGGGGDGGAATTAQLDRPYSVAIDGAGRILIADYADGRVRRVAADGTITTIAQSGSPNAGPTAQLQDPPSAVGSAQGGAVIADGADVESLNADGGPLGRLAGTGTSSGSVIEAGAASAVSLGKVTSVAPIGDGSILIADGEQSRVRLRTPDGNITTVAGSGNFPIQFAASAPLAAAPPAAEDQASARPGTCPGRPSASAFQVSFLYFGPITVRVRGSVNIRSSADAELTLIIRRKGRQYRSPVLQHLHPNKNPVPLRNVKPGRYSLELLASTPDPSGGARSVYSCAEASVRVIRH